jgi:hypothetical protein
MAAVYHLDPQAIKQQLLDDYRFNVKKRSDKLINYFLLMFFVAGLALAGFYDTYTIALGVGGTLIIAYYSVKWLLPSSTLYQYVLSVSLGIFMAQFIYQMHGLFEMHFFAFISGAILLIKSGNYRFRCSCLWQYIISGLITCSQLDTVMFTSAPWITWKQKRWLYTSCLP